jgi:hypothetical protein
MDIKTPAIDLYFCPDVGYWVADFVNDLTREYLHGTTELVLDWLNPDDLEGAVDYLQAECPGYAIRVRNTRHGGPA